MGGGGAALHTCVLHALTVPPFSRTRSIDGMITKRKGACASPHSFSLTGVIMPSSRSLHVGLPSPRLHPSPPAFQLSDCPADGQIRCSPKASQPCGLKRTSCAANLFWPATAEGEPCLASLWHCPLSHHRWVTTGEHDWSSKHGKRSLSHPLAGEYDWHLGPLSRESFSACRFFCHFFASLLLSSPVMIRSS